MNQNPPADNSNPPAKPGLLWQENYSVHLGILDEQHKHLFNLINDWYAELHQENVSPAGLRVKFSKLEAYVNEHFRLEEMTMEYLAARHGFPAKLLNSQIKAHKLYKTNIFGKLAAMVSELDDSLAWDLKYHGHEYSVHLRNLAKWWVPHIQGLDQEYAEVLSGLSESQTVALYEHVISSLLSQPAS